MSNLIEAADNLLDLIEGKYNKVSFERWGMKEYDDFEQRYLDTLTAEDKINVFSSTYRKITGNKTKENIERLFYLAPVYKVDFYEVYFKILESETSALKKNIFFNEMHYYINDCWNESDKQELTTHQKTLIKKYCSQYGLDLPY